MRKSRFSEEPMVEILREAERDIVADAPFYARKPHMLTVVDLFTRGWLAIDVRQSPKGKSSRALTAIAQARGLPRTIKSDDGSVETFKVRLRQ